MGEFQDRRERTGSKWTDVRKKRHNEHMKDDWRRKTQGIKN